MLRDLCASSIDKKTVYRRVDRQTAGRSFFPRRNASGERKTEAGAAASGTTLRVARGGLEVKRRAGATLIKRGQTYNDNTHARALKNNARNYACEPRT